MTILVTLIHVIVCIFLILVILLQAGRGQGLTTSSFGAGAQTFLGTKTNAFMKKLTSVCAIMFLCTSLILVVFSIRGNRSVFSSLPANLPINAPITAPVSAPVTTTTTSTTSHTETSTPPAAAVSSTPTSATPTKAQ